MLAVSFCCWIQPAFAATKCSDYNFGSPDHLWGKTADTGNQEHRNIIGGNGWHSVLGYGWFSCTYIPQGTQCNPTSHTFADVTSYEQPIGNEPNRPDHKYGAHYIVKAYKTEVVTGGPGKDEPQARLAVDEDSMSCANTDANCRGTDISFTISFTPIEHVNYGSTGYRLDMDSYWFFNNSKCPYQQLTGLYSPTVIDLNGDNFQTNFTDGDHGITWDFYGRGAGNEVQMAWTRSDANVGFLWLDRSQFERGFSPCFLGTTLIGCNGKPDSGKELFGNITPQGPPAGVVTSYDHPYSPTGFGALRVFDANGDGQISSTDPVYGQLRVWVDRNHNGILDSGDDNYTLADLGITSISVVGLPDGTTDQYGNVKWLVGSLTGRQSAIYDVLFTGDPN